MKRFIPDILSLLILFFLVAAFFARLFYPTSQLLVTPDFGRSDAWHFSMPTKFALSESIKKGALPLWRSDIGTGFPLFAEGQTGSLYLPNLILFRYLDWVTAYNILLSLSVLTLGAGMYFLLRVLGAATIGALFGAISISFSGLSILQLPHISLLQAISLLPFIVGVSILALQKNTLFHYSILALLITQQMFVGFPQVVFLTMCVLYSYALYLTIKTKKYWRLLFLFLATVVGLMGAAAQLLPSYEFLKASTHPNGFDQETASMFSMPLSHILSFIHPFAFGNPKLGTYPPFYRFDASIFWENTAYLGIFPILFMLYWFLKSKHPDIRFYLFLILGSILFAWGKHSPIYLLYGVWPLSFFRAPSRFLWITSFAIIIASSLQLSNWWNHAKSRYIKGLLLFSLLLQTVLLVSVWWSYHLYIPQTTLLAKPPQLPEQSLRFTTIGESLVHNRLFTTTGWSTQESYLTTYRALSPLSNIFWHVSQYGVYAGRFLKRQSIYNDLLTQEIQLSSETATISASALSLLSTSSVKEIHSFLPIDNTLLQIKQKIDDSIPLYTYTNPHALDQAYIATTATTASTLNEAISLLSNPFFATAKSALVSKIDAQEIPLLQDAINQMPNLSVDLSLFIQRPSHTKTIITLSPVSIPLLLVLSDTYYPDWKATVDGKNADIFPVNITYRGVVLPKGSREVIFTYSPKSVRLGLKLSLLTHLFIAIAVVCQVIFLIFRTRKKARLPSSHPSHNHDT